MMKYKALLASLIGILSLVSCERAIIPESRFVAIYHDIFLADAYVGMIPGLDSLTVYQGIIEKHGYTIQQFKNAQDFYIAHPDDFAKMMKQLQQQLIAEKKEIQIAYDEQCANDTTKLELTFEHPHGRHTADSLENVKDNSVDL